jgi:hypothetical protein
VQYKAGDYQKWIGSPSVKASTVWPPEWETETFMTIPVDKAAAQMTAMRLNLTKSDLIDL